MDIFSTKTISLDDLLCYDIQLTIVLVWSRAAPKLALIAVESAR
jgi:hypothetical protein